MTEQTVNSMPLMATVPEEELPAFPIASLHATPEPNKNDANSVPEEDFAMSTASITSSIIDYRNINGYTYHSSSLGATYYWAPNDNDICLFLDIMHCVFQLCLDGRLYLAPLSDSIKKVLDIGTGTGIWAIDFADKHPNTTVLGTDLSLIQPGLVPPNMFFEIENFEQWSFDEKEFDYIHLRYLVGAVQDWTTLARNAFKTLKPGGYVEHFEFDAATYTDDGTVTENMAISKWGEIFQSGCDKLNRNICFNPLREKLIHRALEEAGFINIVEKPLKIPCSEWPVDPKLHNIGLYLRAAFERGIRSGVNMPATQLGWSSEEISVYCAHLRNDMRNLKIHAYFKTAVIYAQRPLES